MSIQRLSQPPGRSEPYIIPAYEGEAMTIPGTKTVIRILASAKETDTSISVFHFDGVTGDAPGFHYHNEAHDIFMCTKGQVKVWAGDKCRILSPGDFCSVPPNVIHQPQLIDPLNESLGLVTPGDWVDFFRFVSDKYEGVQVDEFDNRNTLEKLFPLFRTIKEKFDVVFQPQHVGCEVGEWTENDTKIPEGVEPYYLKANTGPRYLLGGILSRPFITTKQSAQKFAITSIESSNQYSENVLSKPFKFEKAHQVYCVLDGSMSVTVDGKANDVRSGETVFIPVGTATSITFNDRYVRFWAFSSHDGLETLVSQAGEEYNGKVIPEKAQDIDMSAVKKVAENIGLSFEA